MCMLLIHVNNTVGRSVIGIKSMISDSDDLMNTYSVVVECEINPTASAGYVEVIARNDSAGLNPETSKYYYTLTIVVQIVYICI